MATSARAPIQSPAKTAQEIRKKLASGGTAAVAASAQRFFIEAVDAHGWRTAVLRRFAHEERRKLLKAHGIDFVVEVADQLFRGRFNEEKNFAIFLLEQSAPKLGDVQFELFVSWLDRATNWSDHDGITMYLTGPMMAAKPGRAACVRIWCQSGNVWRRRAAAVSLIRGIRRGLFWRECRTITRALLNDKALMVQKGVGWMLREAAKANPAQTIPFLISIREKASRLVLRTACETLRSSDRRRVLR